MSTHSSRPNVHPTSRTLNDVWDVGTLQWVAMLQPILNAGSVTIDSVSVSNMIPAVETGLAKHADLANLSNLDVALSTRTKPADQQHTIVDSGSLSAAISGSISNTAFGVTGDVAVTNSATAGKTKLATTPDNPSNLDVALSTRLKAGDTLTKVSTVDTITNAVAVTNSGLSNIPSDPAKESGHLATIDTSTATIATASSNWDVALSTRLKPADTLAGVTTVGTVTTITNPVEIEGVSSLYEGSAVADGATRPFLQDALTGRLRVDTETDPNLLPTLMRAMILRLDLIGSIMDNGYSPPDNLYEG